MLKVYGHLGNPSDNTAPTDILELPYDHRKRGRIKAETARGLAVGLFLERGKCLQDGDLLEAESGEVIQIVAAKEELIVAKANDPLQFAKICYHLGNRHVPLQIGDFWIRFQPDHVLEELCRYYHLEVSKEQAPFQPESGAYGAHSSHQHSHVHSY